MSAHYCVRVYANGSAKHTVRDEAGLESWLAYNRRFRPGNALFVDGRCVGEQDRGYLSPVLVRVVEAVLAAELRSESRSMIPEPKGPQVEIFGGIVDRWVGYPPEADRKPFSWPAADPETPFVDGAPRG